MTASSFLFTRSVVMKYILGRKLNMSQVFRADGTVVPVTRVAAGPCQVLDLRTTERHGYTAVQIGFEAGKKINKPDAGQFKGIDTFRLIREVRTEGAENLKRGDRITVSIFQPGDRVEVIGVSKGKGFQGVVKRHGFGGHPVTHGHKDQLRMPGSIGATGPQRVLKGKRMAGRMGGDRVTVKNLEIVSIDTEKNEVCIKGAIPGARGSLVVVQGPGVFEPVSISLPKEESPVVAVASVEPTVVAAPQEQTA